MTIFLTSCSETGLKLILFFGDGVWVNAGIDVFTRVGTEDAGFVILTGDKDVGIMLEGIVICGIFWLIIGAYVGI